MNIERLTLMIEMLEEIQQNPKHKENEKIREFNLSAWYCGTSACAIGYAMFDSRFPGLDCASDIYGGFYPTTGECRHWNAVCEYFGLERRQQAHYLFCQFECDCLSGEVPPSVVANRIREFIGETGND